MLVSELTERITEHDLQLYRSYVQKHGPLSPARMYDRPAALIAYLISKTSGGNPKSIADFMPFEQPRDTINFEDD